MILTNITVSFTMTIPAVEVNKEGGIINARIAIKKMAYDMFVHCAEPFDGVSVIDCPDYPALIE